MQYLYDAGDKGRVHGPGLVRTDVTPAVRSAVEARSKFMQPSSSIQIMLVNGRPSGVQLPASVELDGLRDGAGR